MGWRFLEAVLLIFWCDEDQGVIMAWNGMVSDQIRSDKDNFLMENEKDYDPHFLTFVKAVKL